ncbi:putative protein kinase RLK-Pelle-DLSV family [Helianthus anomalus]
MDRGYMAPEYLAQGHLTEKVDVYSFGVLLLKVVTRVANNTSKIIEYNDSLVTTVSIKTTPHTINLARFLHFLVNKYLLI